MSRSALADGLRHLRGKLAAKQRREESDEQLLQAFAERREEDAFAVLVHRHGPMVLHVCRRVLGHEQDAEDAFQATFLVLARNAAALRNKASLVSFLHGTAYRTAMKAKQAAVRRRKHEGSVEARTQSRSPAEPAEELSWREVRALLDEEIARLPEIYRSVFVLCCLENLSRAEATQRLGLKECTVMKRLAEARKRLSQRLARRGVELSAVLAAATLATQTATALPVALMVKTVDAAMMGVVSAAVAELMKGAASALMVSKIKIVTVVLLAASLLGGAGMWLSANPQTPVAPPSGEPAALAAGLSPSHVTKPDTAKTVEIQGRVLGIKGKPKAAAKLLLIDEKGILTPLGVSAADGRFTVVAPKESKSGVWPALLAQSDDAGIDFVSLAGWDAAKPVELRLVKDQAIRGRIVNTEGKPVVGVSVGVRTIDVYPNNSLDSFLIAWKKRPFNRGPLEGVKILWSREDALLSATTDADGRFALHGVGAERFAELDLQGAGIAHSRLAIVNRDGFDPKPYNRASLDNIPKGMERIAFRMKLHGPNSSVVAEPEKVIRGTVKDADSGKELPIVVIHLEPSDDRAERVRGGVARTDARGRYEFHGIGRAKAYRLVTASNSSTGYLACQVRIANNTAGYSPLTADVRLKKGVIVTGKVIDRTTGKSLPGVAKIGVLFDNRFVKEYQRFGFDESAEDHWSYYAQTASDGLFRVVTIPGTVLLMGRSDEDRVTGDFLDELKYKLPKADAKYPQYFREEPPWLHYTPIGGGKATVAGNFCKVLDIEPGTAIVHQDIFLDRATALEVKVQDADGRPVADVLGTDFASHPFTQPLRIKKTSCLVYSLEVRKPRLLVFYDPKKRLVGSRTLKGDEKDPVTVKLGTTGAIAGRLLDADGKPLAGVVVDVSYQHYAPQQIHQLMHERKQAVTDATGAFRLDEVIPDVKFELSVRRGRRRYERKTKPSEATVQVPSGECRDLGAMKLKPLSEKSGE